MCDLILSKALCLLPQSLYFLISMLGNNITGIVLPLSEIFYVKGPAQCQFPSRRLINMNPLPPLDFLPHTLHNT